MLKVLRSLIREAASDDREMIKLRGPLLELSQTLSNRNLFRSNEFKWNLFHDSEQMDILLNEIEYVYRQAAADPHIFSGDEDLKEREQVLAERVRTIEITGPLLIRSERSKPWSVSGAWRFTKRVSAWRWGSDDPEEFGESGVHIDEDQSIQIAYKTKREVVKETLNVESPGGFFVSDKDPQEPFTSMRESVSSEILEGVEEAFDSLQRRF